LTIGENNPILIDVLLGKDDILTIKNKNESFIPVQQILNNKVKISCNDYPQQAGNFGVYKQNESLKNISFNYNRTESNLVPTDESMLSDYTTSETIETIFTSLQANRTDTELWKWFVMIALLFLVIEVFIQKFVK
jgi:hypothetical protein